MPCWHAASKGQGAGAGGQHTAAAVQHLPAGRFCFCPGFRTSAPVAPAFSSLLRAASSYCATGWQSKSFCCPCTSCATRGPLSSVQAVVCTASRIETPAPRLEQNKPTNSEKHGCRRAAFFAACSAAGAAPHALRCAGLAVVFSLQPAAGGGRAVHSSRRRHRREGYSLCGASQAGSCSCKSKGGGASSTPPCSPGRQNCAASDRGPGRRTRRPHTGKAGQRRRGKGVCAGLQQLERKHGWRLKSHQRGDWVLGGGTG